MSLRVVIVDDEPLARRRMQRLLAAHEDVEVVGEATNGDEAVGVVLEAHPDALFMDVRMPGSDGLTALRRLREKLPADVLPMVVFTTAYEDHAVEAFELEGTDYLVKPVDKAALGRALQRERRGRRSMRLLPSRSTISLPATRATVSAISLRTAPARSSAWRSPMWPASASRTPSPGRSRRKAGCAFGRGSASSKSVSPAHRSFACRAPRW
jgi:two-component system LytT family response regulator